ncbi:transketolase [Moorella sp. E308F]|uniref:transketolase n=1 Tax=Moorella sp. E308F TaxID=2572682 RepID=UPI0010FFC5D5|nr:transketolase [Moorella sp. E308F]GEA15703.1 transketolase [Moorella sp. E308F]
MITGEQKEFLQKKAARIRRDIVDMVAPPKIGHLGGSASCAEIIAVLYFYKLRHDPQNPNWPERDRFIMSKGHSGLAQYAALAECGYFPREELRYNKELGCHLQGHPDMRKTPGIEANTGSLGQGLSIGLGLALAAKLDNASYKVYVLLGDGELAEGQVWEAAMAAAAYRADNLVAIVDKNNVQATGPIKERMDMGVLKEKWEAFGWYVLEVDGHDVGALASALDEADTVCGRPVVIITHTVKGKGIPFAEHKAAYHNAGMTEEEYQIACAATEAALAGGDNK